MRMFISIGLCGLCSASPIVSDEIVRVVNKNNLSWVAEDPERNQFANFSVEEIQGLMGLMPDPDYDEILSRRGPVIEVGDLPDAFDARMKWPSCKKPVRNQAQCGSCWAFAAAETLADNLCVIKGSSPVLSPQDLLSCDSSDNGCKGGALTNVWNYIQNNGIETDSSVPYKCADGCDNNAAIPHCTHGAHDPSAYGCPVMPKMLATDGEIQAAVVASGAVEVGFNVMSDFMNYKHGVYKHHTGKSLGGHAVKIVGWGKESEQFYWIVQNSWGPNWGEDGFFRIANRHDDKVSNIGMFGGYACVKEEMPVPPAEVSVVV